MPSPRSTLPWRCLLIAALGLAIGTGLQAAPVLKLLAFPVPGLYDLGKDGSVAGPGGLLMNRLIAASRLQASTEVMPVPRAFSTLMSPPPSCIVGMVRTPERETTLQWVGLVSRAELAVYARRGERPLPDTNPPLAALRGRRVVVVRDTAMAAQLRELGVEAQEVSSNVSALRMLQVSRVDYWYTHQLLAEPAARATGGTPIQALLSIARIDGYLACNPAVRAADIDAMRQGLQQMRRNGALAEFGLR